MVFKKKSKKLFFVRSYVFYDTLSFDINGKKKFVEVKTTKGNNKTTFFFDITWFTQFSKLKIYCTIDKN